MVDIQNAQPLIDLFGHWPDFHDAEVRGLRLDVADYRDPGLEIDFEVAEMSSEVDERGYYRDRQRARTTLSFARVANLRIKGVYRQNVVSELTLEPAEVTDCDEVLGTDDDQSRCQHRVRWSSTLGLAAEFLCDEIAVVRAGTCVRAS
jgi:hypothetical protein